MSPPTKLTARPLYVPRRTWTAPFRGLLAPFFDAFLTLEIGALPTGLF